MSNNLVLGGNNSGALAEFVREDAETRAVAGGKKSDAPKGNKRISFKGNMFRKMVGGKEVAVVEERHLNVIFVKMAPKPSRTYYASAYKEGEKVGPVCWSSDSEKPDPQVKEPKASACNQCQFSIDGSGAGGMGKACKIGWRTAVVLPQDPGGDVMQVVFPGQSAFKKEDNGRWGFRPYCQYLDANGYSAKAVVTKMQFDTKSPVPKVLLSPVSVVDESIIPILQQQAASQAAENAVKLNVFQSDDTTEAPEVPAPVLRETKQAAPAPDSEDVSDVIKKWSKKK